jgi:hypothetical protein
MEPIPEMVMEIDSDEEAQDLNEYDRNHACNIILTCLAVAICTVFTTALAAYLTYIHR